MAISIVNRQHEPVGVVRRNQLDELFLRRMPAHSIEHKPVTNLLSYDY